MLQPWAPHRIKASFSYASKRFQETKFKVLRPLGGKFPRRSVRGGIAGRRDLFRDGY